MTLWPQGRYVTTHIIVARKFLDAHPDIVKEVLEANLRSLDYIASNPADAQKAANAEIEKITQNAQLKRRTMPPLSYAE
jgi:NitT/TauT family transport system substrate-binding protein